MARDRHWAALAPGTRRRWTAAYGGSRSQPPAKRAARAQAAYERGAHLSAEERGHAGPPERLRAATFFAADPPRLVRVQGLSRTDMARAGRYMELVGLLVRGRPSDGDFARKVGRWRPLAGFTLLADPAAVRALAEEVRASDEEIIFDSGRAGRVRRRR